jgi:hypothetical protein
MTKGHDEGNLCIVIEPPLRVYKGIRSRPLYEITGSSGNTWSEKVLQYFSIDVRFESG